LEGSKYGTSRGVGGRNVEKCGGDDRHCPSNAGGGYRHECGYGFGTFDGNEAVEVATVSLEGGDKVMGRLFRNGVGSDCVVGYFLEATQVVFVAFHEFRLFPQLIVDSAGLFEVVLN
jgi:hypothetical protein